MVAIATDIPYKNFLANSLFWSTLTYDFTLGRATERCFSNKR